MLKVECSRCEAELEQPGALVFGTPDTDHAVNKFHLCVTCWSKLLCWLYNDGEVIPHGWVSGESTAESAK